MSRTSVAILLAAVVAVLLSSVPSLAAEPAGRAQAPRQDPPKPPRDWSGKRPPQSGVTDLPVSFKSGTIRARLAPGAAISTVMQKHGLSGSAALVNHPPFGRAALAAGLDREFRIEVPAGAEKAMVKKLAAAAQDFEFVQMDWVEETFLALTPVDTLYQAGFQGNVTALGMPSAWDVSVATPSVVVAFIGTGIRGTHEDLTGKQVTGHDFSVSPARDIPPGTSYDPCDHESLVTGAGAASTNNGRGIASTGFNVSIMPVKTWSDSCFRSTLYTRADAISWAFDHGAAVINLSYEHYDIDGGEASIIQAVHQYGGAVVAAAGNDNRDASVYSPYPCVDLYLFCIGASDNSGNRWKTADASACPFPTADPGTTTPLCGSNYGSPVDYAAPGIGIWSTSNRADAGDLAYEAGDGTSIAAPQASGILGLLKATGCTPDRSHEALYTTSSLGMSPWTAFGFINAGAALHHFGSVCPP
ncbi:MAG TPA: S8 family serine peptidase [Gemmatimonadaceae bacterium]|nr:S8 family serine peptidase [Gemmatimonadaceae bacterium]